MTKQQSKLYMEGKFIPKASFLLSDLDIVISQMYKLLFVGANTCDPFKGRNTDKRNSIKRILKTIYEI
jgi:hypothetical protein